MAADVLKPNKVPLFANENIYYQYFEVCLRVLAFVLANRYNCDVN